MSARGCMFCVDAGSDFDYCRICGRGTEDTGPDLSDVKPMQNVPYAVRLAGGFLSTDGPREREAFRLRHEQEQARV